MATQAWQPKQPPNRVQGQHRHVKQELPSLPRLPSFSSPRLRFNRACGHLLRPPLRHPVPLCEIVRRFELGYVIVTCFCATIFDPETAWTTKRRAGSEFEVSVKEGTSSNSRGGWLSSGLTNIASRLWRRWRTFGSMGFGMRGPSFASDTGCYVVTSVRLPDAVLMVLF